jgi:hypothetical protein
MTIFYWVMAALIVLTLLPSALFFVLYMVTGENGAFDRAAGLFRWTRVFTLLFVNVGIWGNVLTTLWRMVFR